VKKPRPLDLGGKHRKIAVFTDHHNPDVGSTPPMRPFSGSALYPRERFPGQQGQQVPICLEGRHLDGCGFRVGG
jgi:hypothetical protein